MNDCRHGAIESYCPSYRLSELEAENERQVREIRNLDAVHREKYAKLQAELELAETVMRNHDCHDVWSDAIKEVEHE